MKTPLFLAFALCITTFLTQPATAQAQTTTERPLQELFQTETVYSQEKGELQFTFISNFSQGAAQKLFQTPVAIEYGVADEWQVSVEWSATNHLTTASGKTRGPGELRIGAKHSWMNIGHSDFHVAAGFELGLPTGSTRKGLSEGKFEYEPYVVVAKDFPKLSHLQIFSQLGLSLARSGSEALTSIGEAANKTVEWNNGLFVPYRRARLTAEINWSKSAAENSLYFTPGVVWKMPRDLEFGVGVPIWLSPDADHFRTIVKLTYEFGGAGRSREVRLTH